MPTLADIRKQYPQYASVPDDKLATALRTKYYPNTPVDQFNKAIGYAPQTPGYQAALADARAEEKQRGGGTASQALTQSALLGYGDELLGVGAKARTAIGNALGSLTGQTPKYTPDEAEAATKQAYNEGLQSYQQAHPTGNTVANVAGGFLTPGLGAVGDFVGAGKGLISTMARGALSGGLLGAASGAGNAQNGQRLAGAGRGAAIGAVTGGAAPAVAGALSGVAQGVGNTAKTLARAANNATGGALLSPARVAAQRLAETLSADGLSPTDQQAAMNSYLRNGVTPSLVDIAGPNSKTAALLRGAAIRSTQARPIVANYANATRGGAQQAATDMSYGLTPNEPRPANVVQAGLKSDRAQQAAIEYPRSYGQIIPTDPVISAMGGINGTKAIGNAFNIADSRRLEPEMNELLSIKNAAADPGLPPPNAPDLPKGLEGLSPAAQAQVLSQLPDLARIHAQPIPPAVRLGTMDQVSQAYADMIENAEKNNPRVVPGLIDRQTELQNYMSAQSPEYQNSLNNYAQRSRNMNAIDVGATGLTAPANEYHQALQGLAAPADHTAITAPDLTQDMAGVGMRQQLVNTIQAQKDGTLGTLNRIGTTPSIADNLHATYGPDAASGYLDSINALRDRAQTANAIDPNAGPRTAMNVHDASGVDDIQLPPMSAHGLLHHVIDKINLGAKLSDAEQAAIARLGVSDASTALPQLQANMSAPMALSQWTKANGGSVSPYAAVAALNLYQQPNQQPNQ